jgi:hypothetical protein
MKYKPEVFRLMKIIEEQKRALELTTEPNYILGKRTMDGSVEKPKKKAKVEKNVYERLNKLEAKIKRLVILEKRVDVLFEQLFGGKK